MIAEPARKPDLEKEPNLWLEYERRKSEIPADLGPRDYMIACEEIAADLGI